MKSKKEFAVFMGIRLAVALSELAIMFILGFVVMTYGNINQYTSLMFIILVVWASQAILFAIYNKKVAEVEASDTLWRKMSTLNLLIPSEYIGILVYESFLTAIMMTVCLVILQLGHVEEAGIGIVVTMIIVMFLKVLDMSHLTGYQDTLRCINVGDVPEDLLY